MKLKILEILTCPNCFNFPLEIRVFKEYQDEIIEGELRCLSCGKKYIIQDKIARMMPEISKLDKEHQKVMEANLKYHDVAAKTYEEDIAESVHQNEFNQNRIEKIIKDLSRKTENNYFLDVGCGTGNLLRFGKKYFKNVVGVDVSANMLNIAKERGYEVIQADALALPFKSNIFNTVSIFSVLHHLYDYNPFFNEASRVLQSRGFLYTDWDPRKQPKIDEEKVSWRIFKLTKLLGRAIKKLLLIPKKPQGIDLRKIKPELKKLYDLAEYHNLALKGEERGIDYDELKGILTKSDFINIVPTFHEGGKLINRLSIPAKIKFWFLKFQNYPPEHFIENLMIIAQKK